jgi:hypothetical protein
MTLSILLVYVVPTADMCVTLVVNVSVAVLYIHTQCIYVPLSWIRRLKYMAVAMAIANVASLCGILLVSTSTQLQLDVLTICVHIA